MVALLLLLLLGGGAAWLSERWHPQAPRWVSVVALGCSLVYLTTAVARLPVEALSLIPAPDSPQTWLAHYRVDWIPRFGCSD